MIKNYDKLIKYLKNKSLLFMVQRKFGLTDSMDDAQYLKRHFKAALGYELNLEKPETFNQKLQWLKLYNRKSDFTKMVDKFEAKKYVASIIGEKYIIPTIGVWSAFDEIDFKQLPNQFVLKCTHDSGGLSICRDKKNYNINIAKKKIESCLKRDFFYNGREWQYKHVIKRIIAEEYIESEHGLRDYKFFNFNGKSKFLYISEGLENHSTASISFFDFSGNQLPFRRSDYKPFEGNLKLPEKFEEMHRLSDMLAKAINNFFVRTDFYCVNDKIYFSEITFFPNSGLIPFEPVEWDKKIGELLIIPPDKLT